MSASPADDRSTRLSMLGPRGWYTDHLTRSVSCACTIETPDQACDQGVALFRLAKSAREDEKQRRKG